MKPIVNGHDVVTVQQRMRHLEGQLKEAQAIIGFVLTSTGVQPGSSMNGQDIVRHVQRVIGAAEAHAQRNAFVHELVREHFDGNGERAEGAAAAFIAAYTAPWPPRQGPVA